MARIAAKDVSSVSHGIIDQASKPTAFSHEVLGLLCVLGRFAIRPHDAHIESYNQFEFPPSIAEDDENFVSQRCWTDYLRCYVDGQ